MDRDCRTHFWVIVVYAFNFRFLADKMFYQPEHKILVKADKNKLLKNKLAIGVTIKGESKADGEENEEVTASARH